MIRHHKVLAILVIASLGLYGCFFKFLVKEGYWGTVTAHLAPQPVDALHSALSRLGSLEGPRQIKGGAPNCRYYEKRLVRSGVVVSVNECHGATKNSETGWGYWVGIVTIMGREPEVQMEIQELLEEIRSIIKLEVGEAKVTVFSQSFSP